MTFETKKDILNWYEAQPSSITPEFLSSINWGDVRRYPFREHLVPVLFYMRDVESLTDMYYRELRRTPTGRDPYISKFMARWGGEELVHGQLLDRFLNELGYDTDERWYERVRSSVGSFYKIHSYAITTLTNLVGKRFTGTHMIFGAINEMTTGQAYRRLIAKADHPVLTQILRAILREESLHTNFYSRVARLELERRPISQKLARFVVDHFWEPVEAVLLARRARTTRSLNSLAMTKDAELSIPQSQSG